jgi:predicted ester cyclase
MRLVRFLLSLALLIVPMTAGTLPAEGAREASNKAVAARVFDEIFNQGRFEVADAIYAPGFRNHGLKRSVDLRVDQDAVHAEKHAFPDLRMTVDRMVAEGDFVTVLWTFRGTHTAGGYGGFPATGARVEMRGITIWRIVAGRITDEWSSFNELGAYAQVAAHLRWWLLGGLGVLLALVVVVERLVWWGFRRGLAKLRPGGVRGRRGSSGS